jgi:transposase-like protein
MNKECEHIKAFREHRTPRNVKYYSLLQSWVCQECGDRWSKEEYLRAAEQLTPNQ